MAIQQRTYLGLFISIIVACALLFPGLGSFGMWEPHETDRADIAEAISTGAELPAKTAPGNHLEERLAGLGWSIGGKSELAARLPQAILALFTVVALFFLLRPLTGPRIASFASIVMASAPVLLFHGRQLTSGMPLLFGETLAVGGLALAIFGEEKKAMLIGTVAAALGLVVAWLSGGLLIGVAVPAGTIALTLAMNGDLLAIFSTSKTSSRQKQIGALVTTTLAVVCAGAYFVVAYSDNGDIPLITGGLATTASKAKSFGFALEQLAYGWFPWSALAPIAIIGYLRSKESDEDSKKILHAIVLAGIPIGYLAQTFHISAHGVAPYFLAVPMTLAVALAIADMESRVEPERLGALVAVTLLVIMIRDFAQRPETILMGFGFEKLPLSKEFSPIVKAAICASPTGIFVLIMGFIGSGGENAKPWRSLRSVVLAPLVALCFGGYLSFMLVPGLSMDLSSKYAMESYKSFRTGDEPLGVFGPGRFLTEGEAIDSRKGVIEWLSRSERSFVLFPPKDLADIDRQFRKKTGRHIFVLDAKSDRFILATSKPLKSEENHNPVTAFVQSKPFDPPPPHKLDVNFDNKLTLLGWDVRDESGKPYLKRGKDAVFTTYWRCDDKLKKDYKVFMHIDGPGGRIHGDHKPVEDKYPTRRWEKGDYIKDVYTREIPMYQKPGSYSIRLGMYKGNSRLKIVDSPKAAENSQLIGKVELK
ncbi:MAG: hypothetical protein GY854_13520 [Deltaproteobacteria bacterium]|nr:hypothetical protein [Deltaproteobacteria bacterium]